MVAYIYLIQVNIDNHVMFKIGMCVQDPYNYIKRLKAYPKVSKICFVCMVPSDMVTNIETEIIKKLASTCTLVQGKEYFHGDEKDIMKCVTSFITGIYSTESLSCDTCIVPSTHSKKTRLENKTQLHQSKDDFNNKYEYIRDEIKEALKTASESNKFVFNLDTVAKWLDARKSNLKHTLVNSYILNVDYQVTKQKRSIGRGGARHEYIMLTPQAFKLLCMQSRSKKADMVRMYYLELENLLMKYKDDILEKIQQRLDQLEHNEQQKASGKTRYGAIYIFKTPDDEQGLKLGKAIDVAKRLKAHASGLVNDIRVLWIHETEDLDRVESCVHTLLRPYRIRTGKREIYHITLDVMQQAVRECDCLISRWVGKGRKPTRADCKVFIMIDRTGEKAP